LVIGYKILVVFRQVRCNQPFAGVGEDECVGVALGVGVGGGGGVNVVGNGGLEGLAPFLLAQMGGGVLAPFLLAPMGGGVGAGRVNIWVLVIRVTTGCGLLLTRSRLGDL
jgi:hypothetical protein